MGSMRAVIVVMVLLPGFARADDATANRDLVVEYTRLARDAAANGNCDVVRDLGEKVRSLDPNHYGAVYVADEVIAKCLPAPSPVPQGAPVAPPPNIAPPTVAPVVRDAEPPPTFPGPTRPTTPPLDGGRIAGEVLLGGLIASVGVLGGALLGAAACADNSNGDDFGCIATILIGAYGGGILGFGTGVWAAGNYGEETGSFGAAILGGVIGGALGLVVALGTESGGNDTLAVSAVFLGPMIGSIVGFNATRRWKHPQGVTAQRRRTSPVGSFVQIDNGRPSLGMPVMVRGNRQGVPTTTFTLLGGSF